MQPVEFTPGLSHRLLVAVARAHYRGDVALDWEAIAEEAGTTASPKAIQRALAHLAEDGLIEGLCTPAGWLAVRPTARGLGRAGGAARRPAASARVAVVPASEGAAAPGESLEELARARVHHGLERAGAVAAETRERLGRSLAPRLATVRTTMVDAWHTFTTLP